LIRNEKTCNAKRYCIVEYDGYGNRGWYVPLSRETCKARKIIIDFQEVSRLVCMLGFLIAAGPAGDSTAANCRLALAISIICYQDFDRLIVKRTVYFVRKMKR
jgi:hypothetical protein